MKLSLDVIGYGGYFTRNHESLSLEDAIRRAAKFGYDAACIFAHRPLGFPGDLDADRRKKIVDLYAELGLQMGAVVCCNNFMDGDHVLVFPQEKEILYTKAAIDLAADLGSPIVRVMAALLGYFRHPHALNGEEVPKVVETPFVMVTKDNLDEAFGWAIESSWKGYVYGSYTAVK